MNKKCQIESCGRPHLALGYCMMHHGRLRRHGDANKTKRLVRKNYIERGVGYIQLSENKYAVCDAEDFGYLSQFNWMVSGDGYAIRNCTKDGSRYTKTMHREIMSFPKELQVDHINHNRLDNHKANLRLASHLGNAQNQSRRLTNKSGYKGVNWYRLSNKWRARITSNKKVISLGYFESKVEAAKVYNEWAIKLHGEFACLNILWL